jgi:hypothetical protein
MKHEADIGSTDTRDFADIELTEDVAVVPPPALTASSLKPFLRRCGYTDSRLGEKYRFGNQTAPLAGFFGKPWDTRSACLGIVNADADSRAAAQLCLPLGTPTAFVCRTDVLDWYKLTPEGPSDARSIPARQIEGFFREHSRDLAPETIYAAKTRRSMPGARQLWFVDVGLMPAVERRDGETLHRLVEKAIQDLAAALGGQLRSRKAFADLYKTVFWLLAAKLLHEKDVENFKRIDLADVDDVFRRVGRHYAGIEDLPPGGKAWRPAIDAVAASIAEWGYLGSISTESLAYLYEKALIDKRPSGAAAKKLAKGTDIRKELGIHSTPPALVDHMLAQLWPFIEQIEPADRRVCEPACGHAGFLVAAMRWLREFSALPEGQDRHRYLRDRLRGIEVDSFARELAKLSLTIADVPFGNSWRIDDKDMFAPGVLRRAARECTVLLANPPYEPFTPADKARYRKLGEPVTAITKAVEMLQRTLPHLPPGGVFGVVVPQGVLHDKESASVREFLLKHCELTEISLFADNLFEEADHETAILLGRRKAAAASATLWYRRVRERGMDAFKERLSFSLERPVTQSRFARSAGSSLLLPDLEGVWDYLRGAARLGASVHVQQGFQFRSKEELKGREVESRTKRPGWRPAILRVDDYPIWDLPKRTWTDYSPETLRQRGGGAKPGTPQVVVNYRPVARDPWRIKAAVDDQGLPVSSRFLVFRPKKDSVPLRVLWAILNSPIVNAYAYCFSGKRETLPKEWRALPLPVLTQDAKEAILRAALGYLRLAQPPETFALGEPDEELIQKALFEMDAAVLRAYDLPPRLERQLLDLFRGVERKSVGCRFPGYFDPSFRPCIPLHEYLSDEYRRSTAGQMLQRLQPVRSQAAIAALDAAEALAAGK